MYWGRNLAHKIVEIILKCPHCGLPVEAAVRKGPKNCLLYVCPKCHSNVAYYGDQVSIISNKLLKKLYQQKRLSNCGLIQKALIERTSPISDDDVIELTKALEKSIDSADFISLL